VNAYWKKYTTWFDARIAREKAILGVAAIGCVLMLGGDTWVWPAFAKMRTLSAETQQKTQTIAEAKIQLVQLEKQVADPDASARAKLEQLHKELTVQEPMLRKVQASLVPAEQMAQFLKGLLARSHSLQLLSLKTMSPVPVDSTLDSALAQQEGLTSTAASPTAKASLYKHGVEIVVSGSYADLLSYLADLENAPQKMMWGHMALQSNEYPRSTLTLTMYTLSLDKTWLVI
jgi:MSHA biogenesis protein MshJ